MNCQEVIEYMQRQLDGDLDEQEAEILMTHTRQCEDCATMLDRLQLLSAGLENLPKVTPSYSLVDAIMPRLLELQPEASESKQSSVEEPLPIVRRAERAGRFGLWKDRISMRALGGVIAAGVVVGLFLVTYNLGVMDSMDDKADQRLVAESSTSADTSSALNEPLSQELGFKSTQLEKNVEVESAKNLEKRTDTDADIQDKSKKTAIDSDGAENYNNAEDLPQGLYGKEQSPNYETIIAQDQAGDTNQASNRAVGKSDDVGIRGDSIASNNLPSNPITDNSIDGGGNVGKAEENPEVAGSPMLAQNRSVDQMVSPDGIYKAVIVDSQLQIYLIADSTLVFESVKRAGGFGTLQWSDDSKSLVYETLADDGKLTGFLIDPKNGTEQKQP